MNKNNHKKVKKLPLIFVGVMLVISILSACGFEGRPISRYDLDVVDATPNFYVNDFAGIFSEEQVNSLMEKAVNFDKETSGIQVVITTVKSLNDAVVGYEKIVEDQEGNRIETDQTDKNEIPKFTVEEVAYSMFKEYGIGRDDMGILILISVGTGNGDGDIRIETGRQMQFYITDGLSGELLDDYAMDYLYEGKYAEGLISLQSGVIDEIIKKVPSDWQSKIEETETSEKVDETTEVIAGNVSDTNDSIKNNDSEPKDSSKGLIWGFFGTIGAAIAAFIAFIRQKFKGKSDKEAFEESKRQEINALQNEHELQISRQNSIHEQNVKSLRNDYARLEREKNGTISGLRKELGDAKGQISTLTKELEVMKDKYDRVQRLHPNYNFDEEVQNMIENEFKASAQEVDKHLSGILATTPTKDNVGLFSDAINYFDSIEENVRKYVTSDRDGLIALYTKAVNLKEEFERAEQEKRDKAAANKAYNQIRSALNSNSTGNYKTYEALHAALAIYLGLSAAEKAFFPDDSLIEKLKRVHLVAEGDYNDYNSAKKAEKEVRNIIGYMSSADEDDRDKLSRAKRYYNNLNSSQKRYFDEELLRKLNRLIDEADDDYDYQERRRRREADERRRRAAQSSSSSFRSSSSSFGGHGGRPSGGGASRKF